MRDLTQDETADTMYRVGIPGGNILIDGLELVGAMEGFQENTVPTVADTAAAVRQCARWEANGEAVADATDLQLFAVATKVLGDMDRVGNVLGLRSDSSPATESAQQTSSGSAGPRLHSA